MPRQRPIRWPATIPALIRWHGYAGLASVLYVAVLGLLLAIRFHAPDAWYILGGLIFTLLDYPVGNVVPEFLPGAEGPTVSGQWIHDAVGLFATPLALATAYAVIPAVSGQPIFRQPQTLNQRHDSGT